MKQLPKEVPTQPLPKGIAPKAAKKHSHDILIRIILLLFLLCSIIGISQMLGQ